MQLKFEEVQGLGTGKYPELLHFYDNEAQVLFLKDGELYGKITNTPLGDWKNREFEDEIKIAVDKNMENLELSSMPGFGVFGCYKTENTHKLIIYELQIDISPYLISGNIKHSISSPISTFNLNLENPKNTNPEYKGENVLISEDFTPESLFNAIDFALKGNINKNFKFNNKIISDVALKELDKLLV